MVTKEKRYDKDFKLGAVKMVLERVRSITSVAADLGISYNTLHRWVKEFGIGNLSDSQTLCWVSWIRQYPVEMSGLKP